MATTLLQLFNVSDDQLILGTDSFDVLVQEDAQTVADKYAEMRAAYASDALAALAESEFGCDAGTICPPLVYATENDCWPPSFDDMYIAYYRGLTVAWPENVSASPLVPAPGDRTYLHLNGGGYLGPAGALRRVLREIIAEKDTYAEHELGFDERGRIISEGRVEQEVNIDHSAMAFASQHNSTHAYMHACMHTHSI